MASKYQDLESLRIAIAEALGGTISDSESPIDGTRVEDMGSMMTMINALGGRIG